MNLRFYSYYIWIFVCAGLGYLERWINYGQYTWMWFGFQLAAVFFFALARQQILIDRDKRGKDNPF